MSSDWKKITLREAGVSLIDCDHKTPTAQLSGYPYIAIPQLNNGRIDLSDVRHISLRDYELWTKKAKPQPDDIILSRRCNPGETAYVPPNLDCAIGQNLVLLRSNGETIYPPFLRWLVRGTEWWNQIEKYMNTGAIFNSLKCAEIPNIKLSIPPLPAQRRIADILSALDDKIELNRQTNATLEAIAQAIFKEWFVDFNFPGANGEMVESELGLIPEGWRVVQLGEVSDLSWGDTKTTKNSYSSEGYIAYSASGPDGYLPYYDFSRDGIVVSAIGAYSGKTWFAHGYWSCIKNTIRFWSTDDNLSNEYLYLYTSPKGFWPLRGSAQPFISQTDAREKKIIYPGNHLARYFGEVLQPLFQLIRRNDDEAFTLSQTRDSLLPKLMNGEIEV